jgi:hypothetical protein
MYVADVLAGLGREARAVMRATSPAHARLRDHLVGIALVTVGVDLLCAVLALLVERHADQSQVTSFGTALFWTSTQLLTVSSSVQNPLTTGGRVLDVAMELYAITVVATLAGSMGSFMVHRGRELEREREAAAGG